MVLAGTLRVALAAVFGAAVFAILGVGILTVLFAGGSLSLALDEVKSAAINSAMRNEFLIASIPFALLGGILRH
jgi:hypothetical protein